MTHESEPIADRDEPIGHGVAARQRAGIAGRLVTAPLQFGRDWLVQFIGLQGFDRAVALAGQAVTAAIPLLIVYSAVVRQRHGRDLADELVRVFCLKGSTASDLERAFAPPTEALSQVNALMA